MIHSRNTYTGNGSTTQFAVSFTLGYLSRTHVICHVEGEVDGSLVPIPRTLTWITDGLVDIGTAPALGKRILIFRETPKDTLMHDYSDGAGITALHLDQSNTQTIMLAQENMDYWTATEAYNIQSEFATAIDEVQQAKLAALANLSYYEYIYVGDYIADGPITITNFYDLVTYAGDYWRPSTNLTLPYITVNDWLIDEANFVNVGDALIRQELADTTSPELGGALIGRNTIAVDTIADLAVQPGNANLTVIVKGYATSGDAGGGTFIWDATIVDEIYALDTQKGVYVYPDAGTTTGCWVRKDYSEGINVRCFGVIEGSDCAIPFTAALAMLENIDCKTLIVDGNFTTTLSLPIVADGTVLDGINRGSIVSSDVELSAITSNTVVGITIRDLKLEAPTDLIRSTNHAFVIRLNFSSDILIDNVTTRGGIVGMWMYNCTRGVIKNCTVDFTKGDGIHLGHGCSYFVVKSNLITNMADDSISVTQDDVWPRPKWITIMNNTIRDSKIGFGVTLYSADYCTISNNNISRAGFGGIQTMHVGTGTRCTNIAITGNAIYDCCKADTFPEDFWYETTLNADPPITARAHMSAIVVDAYYVTLTGNTVNKAITTLGATRHGVFLMECGFVTFTGNTFLNISGEGIYAAAYTIGALNITSNIFDQVLGSGINLQATAYTTHIIICGNTFGYGQSPGVLPIIVLANNTTVRTMIINNVSAANETISVTGTNIISAPNYF